MKKPYWQKLKDPRWQRRRLSVLEAANFRCRDCGTTEAELHVHHLCYLRGLEPWDAPDGTLIAVCDPCHKPRGEIDETARLRLALLFGTMTQEAAEKFSEELERAWVKGQEGHGAPIFTTETELNGLEELAHFEARREAGLA